MTAKILKFLYYVILICIIAIALLLVVSTFPITGNYKFFVVLSGSMEPAIHTGSVVAVKPEQDYRIGDVITFLSGVKTEPPITHRIYDIKVVGSEPVFITKGDANNAPDSREIAKRDIVGKVLFSIPFVGYVVEFAKKPIGFAIIIIVPAVLIIGDEIRKIFNEVKNKKEKNG